MMHKISAFIAFLLLISLAFSSTSFAPPQGLSSVRNANCGSLLPPDWVVYSFAAISIGVSLYALIYMIGSILNRPQLKGLVRAGLADIAALLVILTIVYAVSGLLCNASFSTIGIDLSNTKAYNMLISKGIDINNIPFFSIAETYLQLLYYLGEKFYRMLILQLLFSGALTSVKVSAGATLGEMQPYTGIEPIMNLGPLILSSVTLVIISVSAQYYILKFFELTAMQVFFPLGVLMRVIPATRSFGAALIGFSLAMYLFYPLVQSYNFIIFATGITIDEGQLNSLLYNAPTCSDLQDCQQNCTSGSGYLDPNTGTYYCNPCILSGPPPEGDSSLCCSKVSVFKDGSCELGKNINVDDPKSMGRGGIIVEGATPEGYITTIGTGLIIGMAVLLSVGSMIPGIGKATNAISGAITLLLQLGASFIGRSFLTFIMNPLTLFGIVVIMNGSFLMLGFILPMIEFIILVELIRTTTASLGEPIDVVQLLKVI